MDRLKGFARWFLNGVALTLGACAMFLAIELAKPYLIPPSSESVADPVDLVVSDVEPITVTRSGAVTARISNRSASRTYSLELYELKFMQADRVLFTCEPYRSAVPLAPGESTSIQLVCPEVERASLPADVGHALRVRSARRML